MGHGVGHVQKKILEALEELTRRNKRDWFSSVFLTIFLYTPWQVDPTHERNSNRIGGRFVVDWNCGQNERRRVWESCRALERRGLIEIKIMRRNVWGGSTKWMEMRLKNEDEGI